MALKLERSEATDFIQDSVKGELYSLKEGGLVQNMLTLDLDGKINWASGAKVDIDESAIDAEEKEQAQK